MDTQHQERVVEEKKVLDEKLEKLGNFFATARFSVLSELEQGLMGRQFFAMEIYSETLERRIENF